MRQTLPQPRNNVNKTITRSVPEIENTTNKHTHIPMLKHMGTHSDAHSQTLCVCVCVCCVCTHAQMYTHSNVCACSYAWMHTHAFDECITKLLVYTTLGAYF